MKALYTITTSDQSKICASAEIEGPYQAAKLTYDPRLKEFLDHDRLLLPALELRLQSAADSLGGTLKRVYDGPLPDDGESAKEINAATRTSPKLRPRVGRASKRQ